MQESQVDNEMDTLGLKGKYKDMIPILEGHMERTREIDMETGFV